MIKTAMAEPDSLKLPINETTPLLAAPDLPDGSSAQSDADVNGRRSGSEAEEHAIGAVAGEDEDGPKSAGRSISPKIAVAILTIGTFCLISCSNSGSDLNQFNAQWLLY
jgi:hypothetical protein